MTPAKIIYLLCGWLLCWYFPQKGEAQSVRPHYDLQVIDQQTHEPLHEVRIVAGNTQTHTDTKGLCTLCTLADTIYLDCLGYQSLHIARHSLHAGRLNQLALAPTSTVLQQAVIQGERRSTLRNQLHDIVRASAIHQQVGNNLAQVLGKIKGMSSIETGSTIGKPVIQGMHSQRILIINNGVRQQGQQWGDDHAPELDMNNAGEIRVIKGAASVRYGSQALGGVIDLVSQPLPYGQSGLHGNFTTAYGSNGRRAALTGQVEGGFKHTPHWAWRVQGTYLNGGDRSTAHYLLNNTGMRETDWSASVGYRGAHLGSELLYSFYHTNLGTLFSAQMGDAELLKERLALGRPLRVLPFSRKIKVPDQKVTHHLLRWNGYLYFPNQSRLDLQYALQNDLRDEFHNRRNRLGHLPSLSLRLLNTQWEARWKHSYHAYWHTETGASLTYTNNHNQPGTGVVPLIPNYTEWEEGIFALQKFQTARYSAEAGLRLDFNQLRAKGIDAYGSPYGGQHHYPSFSYQIGGSAQLLPQLRLTSNVGLGWRAPHVHELYSHGLQHGSGFYVVGDSTLRAERSTKWLVGIDYKHAKLSFSLEGYLQWVDNYIYDQPQRKFMTVVSGTYPIFEYRQQNAFFRGVDGDVQWQILPTLTYGAGFTAIWANAMPSRAYLPYIPSFHAHQFLRLQLPQCPWCEHNYVQFNHEYAAKQRRFDPLTDLTPTSPPAYHLFGAELGGDIQLPQRQKIHWTISATNLFNKQYKEYTNRFRYYAHQSGRDIRLSASWYF